MFGFGLHFSVSGKNGCKSGAAETSSMVWVVLERHMPFSLIEWRTFPVPWQSICFVDGFVVSGYLMLSSSSICQPFEW